MTAAAGAIGTSWMSAAVGRPESVGKSATVEKPSISSSDASSFRVSHVPGRGHIRSVVIRNRCKFLNWLVGDITTGWNTAVIFSQSLKPSLRGESLEQLISNAERSKLDFAERDKCKPVLLGLLLARNLEKISYVPLCDRIEGVWHPPQGFAKSY